VKSRYYESISTNYILQGHIIGCKQLYRNTMNTAGSRHLLNRLSN